MTATYTDLIVERDEDVLVVTLNRPERLNAMRNHLRAELIEALKEAEANGGVRAVVVTGAGDKAFSAGADIAELQERTLYTELSRPAELRRELPRIAEGLAKPVVAAINGFCLGAGLELALACTLRIAAARARLGLPEINLGVIPGSGGTQRLARLVGLGWALHMVLTGEPLTAEQGLRIGLVTEITADQELLPRAKSLARLMGGKAPVALAAARDAVLRSLDMDLASGLDFERKLFAICAATEDKAEGVRAFLEKRKPQFRGR